MGLSKQLAIEKEDYRRMAQEILEEIGEIEECPEHHLLYRKGKFEEGEIYKIATGEMKRKHPDCRNYKLFHDVIKEILDECGDGCPDCEAEKYE